MASEIALRCCFFSVEGSMCPLFVAAGQIGETRVVGADRRAILSARPACNALSLKVASALNPPVSIIDHPAYDKQPHQAG